MSEKAKTVDVREDIRNGREPFRKIMSAVAQLRPGEQLLVIAPFEPVPLFHVMATRGFQHRAQQIQTGHWEVLFSPCRKAISSNGSEVALVAPIESAATELDARGLEPPQPMVKILESLASLPENATLHARTDRRPMHLYAQLKTRGFSGTTEEQNDGSFVTHICRR